MIRTVRVNQRPERIEEPSMTVQLLLVLFLQAKEYLDGAGAHRNLAGVGDYDVRSVSILAVVSLVASTVVLKERTRRCVR